MREPRLLAGPVVAEEVRCLVSTKPLTVREVAERLGVSRAQVYALVTSGKLLSHRFGNGRGAIRVTEEHLAAFVEASQFKPRAELPALEHIQLRDGRPPAGAGVSR
jgi:excisionase family DNA binding protein